jgi:hypothetical protein
MLWVTQATQVTVNMSLSSLTDAELWCVFFITIQTESMSLPRD